MKFRKILIIIFSILVLVGIGIILFNTIKIEKDVEVPNKPIVDNELNSKVDSSYYDTDQGGNRVNNVDTIKNEHNDDLSVISNMSIICNRDDFDKATINFSITNSSNDVIENKLVIINYVDKDNNTYTVTVPIDKIDINEKISLSAETTLKILDSVDYTYSIGIIEAKG